MNWEQQLNERIREQQYRQVNSFLMWQSGELIIEQYYNHYTAQSRNVMRSVAKSILSIAAGIALDKGFLTSLDEPIYHYLEPFGKGLHPYHKAITIRNLLTMTSGIYWIGGVHYHCPLLMQLRRSRDWVAFISEVDMMRVPGTGYNYSEFDVILLTALLEKAVGEDIFSFINKNLYQKLGIQSGPWWRSSCGVAYSCAEAGEGNGGANERPSNLTAREMLKIGQLFYQNGVFEQERILSEEYIKQAVTASKNNAGYGYLWWLYPEGYGCRGYGGQNITVYPKEERIFVIQATPTARGKEYDDLIACIRQN